MLFMFTVFTSSNYIFIVFFLLEKYHAIQKRIFILASVPQKAKCGTECLIAIILLGSAIPENRSEGQKSKVG